jgi:hypothetical protein
MLTTLVVFLISFRPAPIASAIVASFEAQPRQPPVVQNSPGGAFISIVTVASLPAHAPLTSSEFNGACRTTGRAGCGDGNL